jgi:cell division protein FtsI/penicillin-binding protein 2
MKRALGFFASLLVVAGAIVGVVIARTHKDKVTLPSREVDTFLHAWARNDPVTMATLLDKPPAPADLRTTATSLIQAVPGSRATYTRTSLAGTATNATATYHAQVTLKGLGTIAWDGSLPLVHSKPGWLITWSPSEIYPGLRAKQHLTVRRVWPARAPILGADGGVLAGDQAVVQVGLEPDHIKSPTDLGAVKFAMKTLLDVDPATIDKILHAPGVRPFYFLPVTTISRLPAETYQRVHDALLPINGIIFRPARGVVAVDSMLASEILGNVGDITAERLHQLGAPYAVGDRVGLSGLQSVYEKRLAGSPRTDVVIVDARGVAVRVIKHYPGQAPQSVQITIDLTTQRAAETALAGVTRNNAALVAIEPSSGAIRAVVSKPDGGFDRALSGTYPPGSTFKVVTSAALLAAGDTGSTPAPCPPKLTVDGRSFVNFEGEAPGALDLAGAFAISCNNAFIGLADQLPSGAMARAAASFGFNAHWSLGIDSAGGSYPNPSDRAELAASAIGQGRVLASPLQMASVAAAVANGGWRAPTLITSPAPPPGPVVAPLDPAVVSTLKSFMASVVRTGGTAAGSGVPTDAFGKTGTAEFGNANPPHTHAWFIGFRRDIAFAVIVEDGGVGGRVAAPLAAGFLGALSH